MINCTYKLYGIYIDSVCSFCCNSSSILPYGQLPITHLKKALWLTILQGIAIRSSLRRLSWYRFQFTYSFPVLPPKNLFPVSLPRYRKVNGRMRPLYRTRGLYRPILLLIEFLWINFVLLVRNLRHKSHISRGIITSDIRCEHGKYKTFVPTDLWISMLQFEELT